MKKVIKRISSPEDLNSNWDSLAECYFQKKEFLTHIHKYNPCCQRYYELYCDDKLSAAVVVYTLKMNILTFANIPSSINVQIIGLPVSVAAPPVIGDPAEFEFLLYEILRNESGIILGLNFISDHLKDKVVNLRTLPTIILNTLCDDFHSYENSLRHDYRRRLHRIEEKFTNVKSVTTDCSVFSNEHYSLYLQIMKRTKTKLETLNKDLFKYLPSNFSLTTYYSDDQMLCWHIVCKDANEMFFFFGGMNYTLRDKYQSYNNNLLGIVTEAFNDKYHKIDFGQTAEIAKSRFGGEMSERRMFMYHKNIVILKLLRLCRNLITYSKENSKHHVFKTEKNVSKLSAIQNY